MQEFECECQKQPLSIKVVESFIAKDGKSRTRKRHCRVEHGGCGRQFITTEKLEFKLPKRLPK